MGVDDDRVPGTEDAEECVYACGVPGCERQLSRKFVPDCPDHLIPMRPVSQPD